MVLLVVVACAFIADRLIIVEAECVHCGRIEYIHPVGLLFVRCECRDHA